MYGVLSTTPPQSPAASVARPSVARIARVSYSSPAAAALSVLSIPPTMVEKANGIAIGRYPQARDRPPQKAKLGNGNERWSCRPPAAAGDAIGLTNPSAPRA